MTEIRRESTEIWVKFTKHGIHKYPDAPEEVAYLRDPHRHLFHFKVTITVFHHDREIEFHLFQNWLLSLFERGDLQLDYKSCEMLASELLGKVLDKYDCLHRNVSVEVSEDDECGAVITSVATGTTTEHYANYTHVGKSST